MTFLSSQPRRPPRRGWAIAQHTRPGGHRHVHAGRDPGFGERYVQVCADQGDMSAARAGVYSNGQVGAVLSGQALRGSSPPVERMTANTPSRSIAAPSVPNGTNVSVPLMNAASAARESSISASP